MKLPADLTGNWRLPSAVAPEEGEIMHISESGRIVHFTLREEFPGKRFPFAVWAEKVGDTQYRIRIRLNEKGALIELRTEDQKLIIINTKNRYVASRNQPEDLPQWFASELEKVMHRMDEKEARQQASS